MKNKTPFFSVVVTTYNRKDLLKKNISSILNQTFTDFELIIIDNYSNYDFIEFIKSFNDDRIKPYQNQNNGNIAVNRNFGIYKAKYKYISFCDDDDFWFPNKLELVYNSIINNPNCILYCHWEVLEKNGKDIKILKHGPTSRKMYESLLFDGNKVSTSAATVERKIAIEEKGFNESKELLTVEDYDFWLRLAKRGNFHFINQVLGKYVLFGNNESSNLKLHAEANFYLREKYIKLYLKDNKISAFRLNHFYSKMWSYKSASYLKMQEFYKSRKYIYKALKYNPLNFKAWIIMFFSTIKVSIRK